MKTKEELNALKKEVEALNKKLAELSDKELEEVVGGGTAHLIDGVNDGSDSPAKGGKVAIVVDDWQ